MLQNDDIDIDGDGEVNVDVNNNDGVNGGGGGTRSQRKEQHKLTEMATTTAQYKKQSASLIRQLAKFSKDRLALMITVEELGGPVVGTELNVEKLEEMADVYRNDNNSKERSSGSSGSQVRGKGGRGRGRQVREKGQKRIDEIWGRGRGDSNAGEDEGEVEDGDRMDVDVVDPVDAAGNEILGLIEVCVFPFFLNPILLSFHISFRFVSCNTSSLVFKYRLATSACLKVYYFFIFFTEQVGLLTILSK